MIASNTSPRSPNLQHPWIFKTRSFASSWRCVRNQQIPDSVVVVLSDPKMNHSLNCYVFTIFKIAGKSIYVFQFLCNVGLLLQSREYSMDWENPLANTHHYLLLYVHPQSTWWCSRMTASLYTERKKQKNRKNITHHSCKMFEKWKFVCLSILQEVQSQSITFLFMSRQPPIQIRQFACSFRVREISAFILRSLNQLGWL